MCLGVACRVPGLRATSSEQCEAERVRLSIENASLKDQLSRQSINSARKRPNISSVGSGGGGGGCGGGGGVYGFKPALANPFAGHPPFPESQRKGQRKGPPLSVSSPLSAHFTMGGAAISSPSPSWVVTPRKDAAQGLPTSGLGVVTGATPPGRAIPSTQDDIALLSSAAGPAGGCSSSSNNSNSNSNNSNSNSNSNSTEAPRRTSSPSRAQGQALSLPSSLSPGSDLTDSRRDRSTCPAAALVTGADVDVGGLLAAPSGPRNPGNALNTDVAAASASTSVAATSPNAAFYSQHNPSPGEFHGSAGGECDGGGGRTATAAAAAAAAVSYREAKATARVAVRSEHLLSTNVLAGRVVAFAGGAAGAVLVSQEFGERRSQHGITKVG